jgi:hypothetical protein
VGSPRPYDSALISPVSRTGLISGVTCKTYKGSFPWIPQITTLSAVSKTNLPFPEIRPEPIDKMLTVFTGYIKAPADGEYNFIMSCDAKAFLRIHDIQVIDEDYGYPGNLLRNESLFLKAGLHPFSLYYYHTEDKGPSFLKLDWSGPGINRQKIPKSIFFTDKDPGKAKQ